MAGVALLLALGQAPALAAAINVGGGCTLVNAITAANTNNAIGRCRAGRGADTIVLPANSKHTLTQVNNQYFGPNGLPVVTSTITIAGNKSAAAGTPAFRILAVGAGGNLTLRQTTVSGGLLQGDDQPGGGLYRRAGRLTLDGCTISGNAASSPGGGVANGAGTLTVTNSTISGNTAEFAGGVLNNSTGTLIVTNSTISGNTAGVSGGGVYNRGTASLTNSTITNNAASAGNSTISGNRALGYRGGVGNFRGAVTLTNSTVSRNTSGNNDEPGRGGGLFNALGRMSLTNSTVVVNKTGYNSLSQGGGVFSGGRNGNVRSDVVLNRTLISGNSAFSGAEIFQVDGGVVTAGNFNLFGWSGRNNASALSGFILSGASITATSDGSRPTARESIFDLAARSGAGSAPWLAWPCCWRSARRRRWPPPSTSAAAVCWSMRSPRPTPTTPSACARLAAGRTPSCCLRVAPTPSRRPTTAHLTGRPGCRW
ncbi:MAG: hypothetical protein H0V34_11550 [Gammaproteobacteria bacterium]|nr:hypothetical protein [Gammaproteobacteria bacterium]